MQWKREKIWALAFALLIALATAPKAWKLGSPDFKVFYVAARHVFTDPANIYKISPDRYLYPPSTAVLLTPFAFSEHYAFHQWAWHGLLALLVFFLASQGWAELAALALLTRYLAVTFNYGQINLVVILLLGWASAWAGSRPRRSGALWAAAVSVKVYPLVFAPAFFPKGKRAAWWGALAAGACLLALPLALFGPALGLSLYWEFLQALRSKGLPIYSHNQSLAALGLRLFTDQPFLLHSVGEIQWTLLALPPWLVRAVALAFGLLLTAVTWRQVFRKNREPVAAAAFSILFLSHIVWKDYSLWLFFPLWEIFRSTPRNRSFWLAGIFLAMVTLSSPDVVGAPLSAHLDGACIHLWAAVLVWISWIKLPNSRSR
jgi:hypothetical protein